MVLAVGLLTLSYRLFNRSENWNLLSLRGTFGGCDDVRQSPTLVFEFRGLPTPSSEEDDSNHANACVLSFFLEGMARTNQPSLVKLLQYY